MSSTPTTATQSFAEVARGFCAWCESSAPSLEPEVAAVAWLAKLYALAVALPEVESNNDERLPSIPSALHEAAERTLTYFRGMYYREYFDPDPTLNEESVTGDVGDDLLDTYQDIRRGLILFDAGQSTEALWHWSFLHRGHWGRHAVGAMFALHCLFISKRE